MRMAINKAILLRKTQNIKLELFRKRTVWFTISLISERIKMEAERKTTILKCWFASQFITKKKMN
jgi:hypothetical protein